MNQLEKEIEKAKSIVKTNSYDMSIGELMSLYRDSELIIDPDFQRYFRWEEGQKTRFIESIMLGIPIPPIFVFQTKKSKWELVDGLQRVSTILEFTGALLIDHKPCEPLVLDKTKMLPSLGEKTFSGKGKNTFTDSQQIDFKRARIRIEILLKESDPKAKYELFMRLNTGGSALSEQEVRNCVIHQLNKKFQQTIEELANLSSFTKCVQLSEKQIDRQFDKEVVIRYFAYRNIPYEKGYDVHEYLDSAAIDLASNNVKDFDLEREKESFINTFKLIEEAMGDKAFKRFDKNIFSGKFMISAFEVIAIGISNNIDKYKSDKNRKKKISDKIILLWSNDIFKKNSGAGTRGTMRLANLLELAKIYF